MTDYTNHLQTLLDRLRPDDSWSLVATRSSRQYDPSQYAPEDRQEHDLPEEPGTWTTYVINIQRIVDHRMAYRAAAEVAEAIFADRAVDADQVVEKFVRLGIQKVQRMVVRGERLN